MTRLSRGEYVIRASAVRKYGMGVLSALNNMMMPKGFVPGFATGGPVTIPVDVLPQFLDGGIFSGSQPKTKALRPISLTIGDETFDGMLAPEDTAQSLVRYARRRQIRSGGRKPSWFGRGK